MLLSRIRILKLRFTMLIMRKLLLSVFLFIAFFAYRMHFWDYEFGTHILLNALLDVILAVSCGILIYTLNKKYSGSWIFLFSLGLISIFSYLLFYSHKVVYLNYSELLNEEGFYHMFHTLCFQLLDSCSIIITGSLVYLLFLFSIEKKLIQKDLEELTIAKEKEELKYLKTKINPHFIFNGLNSIYHEIDTDKVNAKDLLIQFSDIVRYHLHHASMEQVSFETELKYLRSYIKFRYQNTSDFLNLRESYSVKDKKTKIAPLLVLPFLENAFKYCNSSKEKKGEINVNLNFTKSNLEMNLVNTYDPIHRHNQPSTGIGLQNVKKRLELNYPNRHSLKIEDNPINQIFSCHLKIAI